MAPDDRPDEARASAGIGRTFAAVFWSFFGVRKKADYESDAARLNPVHVIAAGIVGALALVIVLVVIVRIVVATSS